MASLDASQLHQNEDICRYLLGNITTNHAIEIRPSIIPGAGNALFTTSEITEGEEIFRSQPLVNCATENSINVCDFCFQDNASKIHPSGRFRKRNDPIEDMLSCGACDACDYCSESCMNNAWKAYHKYECTIISEAPHQSARVGALYRILVRRKHGLLSDIQWKALHAMASHYEDRSSGSDAQKIHDIATTAKELTQTDLGVVDVANIYCILLTNCICIREAGQSKVLGTSLDMTMSLMNHSCNPNSFTVFEGNELRVRSLRPISAGEELLQCYTDMTCDVLLRQKRLQEQFSFACTCPRCEKELEQHKRMASNDMSRIELIGRSEKQLTDTINDAIVEMMTAPDSFVVQDLETSVRNLADEAYPDGHWPNKLDPMPLLWKRLGNMRSIQGEPLAALRYSVKGCAYTDFRKGQEWSTDLLDLIRILISVLVLPATNPVFSDESFLSDQEQWDVCLGYLKALCGFAEKTFGTSTRYSQAVTNWYDKILKSADQLSQDISGLDARFRLAHVKLMAWANVDENQWVVKG